MRRRKIKKILVFPHTHNTQILPHDLFYGNNFMISTPLLTVQVCWGRSMTVKEEHEIKEIKLAIRSVPFNL